MSWRDQAACSPPSLELDAIKRHSDRWWKPKPPTKNEWQKIKKQTAELAARHARNPQDLDAAEWALLDQVDREQNHDPFVAARAVCGPCPVREACLEYALAHEPDVGMWGGKDGLERRAIKEQRTAARKAAAQRIRRTNSRAQRRLAS